MANSLCITTVVSGEHFYHYVPLFIRCIRQWAEGIDIRIYVRGYLDDMTKRALMCLIEHYVSRDGDIVTDDYATDYPFDTSSTNTLRFLNDDPVLSTYEAVLIVDVDLLLFRDPFPWHRLRMLEMHTCYAGHRGPRRKPYRPEINEAGWVDDFERVAGGFVCVTPEWFAKTKTARQEQAALLKAGKMVHYRELDEVTLGRIIKASGLPMPPDRAFPTELRGLHLGDFKTTMTHRWTSMAKMMGKLHGENCLRFNAIERDACWQAMLEILSGDEELMQELANARQHITERGIR